MSAPSVSVIVPAYNSEPHLAEAVQSVIDQTLTDLEVFIVDDGSKDGTLALARRFADADPRIRVLQHPGGTNRGVAATRNLALHACRADHVAFLDADDRWHPLKLERQLAFMKARPELGLSWTRCRILRETDDNLFVPGEDVLGADPPTDLRDATAQIMIGQLNYIFSTVMLRRDVLARSGLFVEDLPYQSEDRLLVTMIGAYERLGLLPEVLADYRVHGGSYTTGVLTGGTAAPIFFDLQWRLTRWLRAREDRRAWARAFATHILPHTMVAALTTLGRLPRCRANVLRNAASLIATYPRVPFVLALHALFQTPPGRWWRARRASRTA